MPGLCPAVRLAAQMAELLGRGQVLFGTLPSRRAQMTESQRSRKIGAPNRTRTGVSAVRGQRPRPLDDGGRSREGREMYCQTTRGSSGFTGQRQTSALLG